MRVNARQSLALAALMAMVLIAGCAKKESESAAPEATSQAAPQAAAPATVTDHGAPAEDVFPASTVAGIWTQVADEQGKLSAAIQNGQLADVHHLAFGIRDLVVALVEKANADSPAGATKRDELVEQVKASATKLDTFGDAGNLSGTQAEYAKLETVLTALRSVK